MPKNTLLSYEILTGANAAGNLVSAVTNIQRLDNVGIQVHVASGTPTGTVQVQISADYEQDTEGNVLVVGNWINLKQPDNTTLVAQVITAGSPAQTYFDLTQLSCPWIRITYTASSGSGTLNAFITAKAL